MVQSSSKRSQMLQNAPAWSTVQNGQKHTKRSKMFQFGLKCERKEKTELKMLKMVHNGPIVQYGPKSFTLIQNGKKKAPKYSKCFKLFNMVQYGLKSI